jgi:hypothetical protein
MKRTFTWILGLALCAAPLAAQDASRLSIHGYLNQAYATADGGTILGIPEHGTADYRTAALLFRYSLTDHDNLTLEISHRDLGEDIVTAGEPDLKLDWAFYGRQFGDFNLKVGRIPIPSGIYNELRNVGTVLPLYRAPFNFYLEGAFTSEVVDGMVAGYQTGGNGSWGVDASAFYGGWSMVQRGVVSGTVVGAPSRVENGAGGQAWLLTPIDGLRVGAGASRYAVVNGSVLPGVWHEAHASLDGSFTRITLRGEYRKISTPDITYWTYYGYAGLHLTPKLTVHTQLDYADLAAGGLSRFSYNDDQAVGVSYAFRSSLVIKAEGHTSSGYWTDNPVRQIGIDPPAKVKYLILSLATSF